MNMPKCFKCKYAEHINPDGYLLTYCKILDEIICDRQWVTNEICKHCICASCKHFEGG